MTAGSRKKLESAGVRPLRARLEIEKLVASLKKYGRIIPADQGTPEPQPAGPSREEVQAAREQVLAGALERGAARALAYKSGWGFE